MLEDRFHSDRTLDENFSPFLMKIDECKKLIEEIEADRKGVSEDKPLSDFEKYKLGVMYMAMMDNPAKFKHLNRFLTSESK
jgi:hypothetical protein